MFPFLLDNAEEDVVAFLVLLLADGAYYIGFLDAIFRFSLGFNPYIV